MNWEQWFGSGARGLGMSNLDIDRYLTGTPGYMGVIASDAFDELHESKEKIRGFIMNLDRKSMPGSHWVSIVLDDNTKSLEYYDTFGRKPEPYVLASMAKLMPNYKHLRINMIPDQSMRSDTCGYFSVRFLKDRLNGVSFDTASGGLKNATTGEREIKKFAASIAPLL